MTLITDNCGGNRKYIEMKREWSVTSNFMIRKPGYVKNGGVEMEGNSSVDHRRKSSINSNMMFEMKDPYNG